MSFSQKCSLIMPRGRHIRKGFVILVIFAIFYGYNFFSDKEMIFIHSGSNTPCVLPELDPFDPKMMEYVWKPDPLICDPPPVVYVDDNNTLQYNLTATQLLNEQITDVKCEIYYIKRIFDKDIEFETPFQWRPHDPLKEDFFRVKCVGASGTLFDNILTKIHKKDKDFQRIDDALAKDKYNLVLFGIDSLSRSSAIRQLPKTFKYLKSLGAYDMKGYMKVAPHTTANIVPLLSGYFLEEFTNVDIYNEFLNDLPLIWRNFSQEKAVTLFGEDMPTLGMFNMDKKGFLDPPTDHFMRPFWLAYFKFTPMHNLKTMWLRYLEHSKLKLTKKSALCLADKPNHMVIINYIKQFMRTYQNNRMFSFTFLTELSHEYQNLLQLGDDDIVQFITWLKESGYLDNTILVTFSDHGLKFGNNQHLFVARMENRMPFLSIVLPERLKSRYPNVAKSLQINRERLASTFDLHATVRDIFNGNYRNPGQFEINGKLRGLSLFKELPEKRSCADASIDPAHCACYKSTKLNITGNPLADKIATAVVDHINKLLHGHNECETLKLDDITDFRKIEQGLQYSHIHRKHWFLPKHLSPLKAETRDDVRHVIIMETVPGHARFYATCDVIGDVIHVFDDIERINKYGNTSHCVHLHELKSLCHCKKLK